MRLCYFTVKRFSLTEKRSVDAGTTLSGAVLRKIELNFAQVKNRAFSQKRAKILIKVSVN